MTSFSGEVALALMLHRLSSARKPTYLIPMVNFQLAWPILNYPKGFLSAGILLRIHKRVGKTLTQILLSYFS